MEEGVGWQGVQQHGGKFNTSFDLEEKANISFSQKHVM
jgi:hypothetical protein